MTTQMCADDWREIATKAQREAAEWRENFNVLQRALVGETGASGIKVAHALRKDAERYRWLRDCATVGTVHLQTPDGWAHYRSGADEVVDAAMEAARAVGAA